MVWGVIYHPDVQKDLDLLGAVAANRILDVIEERIVNGEPDKSGKPLRVASQVVDEFELATRGLFIESTGRRSRY